MKMRVKGQITIFFLLGLLLICLLLFHSYVLDDSLSVDAHATPTLEIRTFIEACMKEVGSKAPFDVFLQGGYFHIPEDSISFLEANIPILWDTQDTKMLELSDIERQLSQYLVSELRMCIDDFSVFREKGYTINTNSNIFQVSDTEQDDLDDDEFFSDTVPIIDLPGVQSEESDILLSHEFVAEDSLEISKIEVEIQSNNIEYTLFDSIEVVVGDSTYQLDSFQENVAIDLIGPIEAASEIMDAQISSPNAVPIGVITSLAEKNRFSFEQIYWDDNTVILSLIFEVSEESPLIYSWASEYDWN